MRAERTSFPAKKRAVPSFSDLKIVFINGVILEVEPRDIVLWLTDRTTTMLLLIATASFLIYFRYVEIENFLPPEDWQVAVTVFALVCSFFMVMVLLFLACFAFSRMYSGFVVPLTFIVMLAHISNQFIGSAFVMIWEIKTPDHVLLFGRIITLYFVVIGLEIIYSIYILPHSEIYKKRLYLHLTGQQEPSPPAPEQPSDLQDVGHEETEDQANVTEPSDAFVESTVQQTPPNQIRLGDTLLDVADILTLHAEQNYVRITTKSGEILHRARMRDLAELLDGTHGVHAHRSIWISFQVIAASKKLPHGKLALTLTNGEIVNVPRARRNQVLNSLQGRID